MVPSFRAGAGFPNPVVNSPGRARRCASHRRFERRLAGSGRGPRLGAEWAGLVLPHVFGIEPREHIAEVVRRGWGHALGQLEVVSGCLRHDFDLEFPCQLQVVIE